MAKVLECKSGRALMPGKDDDELVANGERHLLQAHPDLVGKHSREQILANAQEAWCT